VTKTVTSHLYEDSYDPTKDLRTWYKRLKDHYAIGQISLVHHIRAQYQEAVKPLIRPPNDYDVWINTWQQVVSKASRQRMAEAEDSSF
ncbi:hypothetical protein F5X68DRAFT_145946, partial [Plectosphaerella plurivora]